MSNIGGKKRESQNEFSKRVGLFEAKVVAINPTIEQFKDILNIELAEDSKQADYLGESKEGNTTLRVDVWLEEIKNSDRFKVSFFLEDKEKENKDGTKKQYINEIGSCSWAEDPNDLPTWFKARDFRQAYVGEEDLYNFLRNWLSALDYRSAETVLQLEWKKLMKGNVKDLKDQINGEWCGSIGCLATVITKDKDGEVKEYQGIYNKAFIPAYTLKNFKLVDYSSSDVIDSLKAKQTKDLKIHEKFVLNVTGEYGCKDFYILKELKEYDSSENFAASDQTMEGDDKSGGSSY